MLDLVFMSVLFELFVFGVWMFFEVCVELGERVLWFCIGIVFCGGICWLCCFDCGGWVGRELRCIVGDKVLVVLFYYEKVGFL